MTGDIRLILDASALFLFGRGALAVGETLAEVTAEGDLYATPVTVYVDVLRRLDGDDNHELADMAGLVRLLMTSPSAVILPVEAGAADALLYWSRVVGVENAACVVAMLARPDCYLLTAVPDLYKGELGDGPILAIED